jgi:hypothetical protein
MTHTHPNYEESKKNIYKETASSVYKNKSLPRVDQLILSNLNF